MNIGRALAAVFIGLFVRRRKLIADIGVDGEHESSTVGGSDGPGQGDAALRFGAIRHYGPHAAALGSQPPLWACSCGTRPLLRLENDVQRADKAEERSGKGVLACLHVVRCPACGRSGNGCFAALEAITDWNGSILYLELIFDEYVVAPDCDGLISERPDDGRIQTTTNSQQPEVGEQMTVGATLSNRGFV